MDEEMIFEMYGTKAAVNYARIENNYDGVSTKCPGCRRAMDDPAVKCRWETPYTEGAEPTRVLCAVLGKKVSIPRR
jgi:hypothetical protein